MADRKTGIILQARVLSTRLPGKILLPFYEDHTILGLLLDRLGKADLGLPIVVATSQNPADDPIVALCQKKGVHCFRGNENDVLQRFIDAAEHYGLTEVIRICSDNPFLSVDYIRELIREASGSHRHDYISFCDINGLPSIKTHWGLFTEYVTCKALREVRRQTTEPLYREHVTNYVYANRDVFDVSLVPAPAILFSRTDLRFTIDTATDFEVCQFLYTALIKESGSFNLNDLVLLVDRNPDIKRKMSEGINNFKK